MANWWAIFRKERLESKVGQWQKKEMREEEEYQYCPLNAKGKSRDKDDCMISAEGLKLSREEHNPLTETRKRKRQDCGRKKKGMGQF